MLIHRKLFKACDVHSSTHKVQNITVSTKAHSIRRTRPPSTTVGDAAQQLTCYNLHVFFCFCPGSFCKTQPSPRCPGTAGVLCGLGADKTQQINITQTPLSNTSTHIISPGYELPVWTLSRLRFCRAMTGRLIDREWICFLKFYSRV